MVCARPEMWRIPATAVFVRSLGAKIEFFVPRSFPGVKHGDYLTIFRLFYRKHLYLRAE